MNKILSVLLVLFISITISAQTKPINISKSKITWVGKKVTGQHEGIIKFKEGALIFKNKKLIGGHFTADMTSLTNTDQSGKDKEKLEGHLRSGDFFDVENFGTSKLVFKSITSKKLNSYTVNADLTIKGKTKPVTFDMFIKGRGAKAKVIIDRTKYGIQYGSGSFFDDLGDRTIYDEFELNVSLFF
ncbi:YceI family protein [Flavobacterium sp. GT3R68]|uniref:YceI family protein n=1 Tax=Flavobacterium sp. GT3R68 TaxID=2594437 RepID=UPI000F8712D0|nr:YceI family protein [Flavobacterium sp. GT3R68]RTY91810.1 YceI family protein [Flavobacterium sp. GSN2]TRW90150.1 YceI family protein [Flavobacterium sp. GT3R68]